MNKNKLLYNVINISCLLSSILLINYARIFEMNFSINQLIILVSIFIIIHIFKFIRIYFILLEERISIRRMIKIYIKTTFVSVIFPYKLGELFKMYSFGNEINNYPKGIIAVLIDKFSDAIILCTILVPYGIINGGNISSLSFILLLFIVIISIIYFTFSSTYYYLNKFFIIKNNSHKSIIILNILEKFNKIYKNTKEMLRGRVLMLLTLTTIIWILESTFVYLMADFINIKLDMLIIIQYINDSFFGMNNILVNNYIYLCASIFLVVIIIIYLKKLINGGIKFGKNSTNI